MPVATCESADAGVCSRQQACVRVLLLRRHTLHRDVQVSRAQDAQERRVRRSVRVLGSHLRVQPPVPRKTRVACAPSIGRGSGRSSWRSRRKRYSHRTAVRCPGPWTGPRSLTASCLPRHLHIHVRRSLNTLSWLREGENGKHTSSCSPYTGHVNDPLRVKYPAFILPALRPALIGVSSIAMTRLEQIASNWAS